MKKNNDSSSKSKMSFWSHLEDFRKTLLYIFGTIFLCSLVSYYFIDDIILYLQSPLLDKISDTQKIVFTGFFEKIWVYFKVVIISGACLALPFILYFLGKFIFPGLKKAEKSVLFFSLLLIFIFFLTGVIFGYFIFLPIIIDLILNFGAGSETPMITVSSYINSSLGILVACGVLLLIPLIMVIITNFKLIDVTVWRKNRKYAFIVNALVSAFLSPPDVVSMFYILLPMQILYELGIIMCLILTKVKKT